MTIILTAVAALARSIRIGALAMAQAVAASRADAKALRLLIDERRLYGDLATYGGTDCDDDESNERTA